MHSESIQTPSLFSVLLPDTTIVLQFYTPYLHMTKWKQNFWIICKFIKKKKTTQY